MSKKHHSVNQEVTEAITSTAVSDEAPVTQEVEVEAETPKIKVGDAPTAEATTTVDGKEKKPRAPRIPKGDYIFRIREGVDATKFVGQRGCVIRALQKLSSTSETLDGSEPYFSLDEIVANTEGLVARVPVRDSVNWHLREMAKSGEVVMVIKPTQAPAAA